MAGSSLTTALFYDSNNEVIRSVTHKAVRPGA